MLIYRPELVSGDKIPMTVTHPKHLVPVKGSFIPQGQAITELGKRIGADAVNHSGVFQEVMLQALDQVSGAQQFASDIAQRAIVDPESVDPQDITIAQAKARLSLDLTRNVLNRVVQGWRDLINTR